MFDSLIEKGMIHGIQLLLGNYISTDSREIKLSLKETIQVGTFSFLFT